MDHPFPGISRLIGGADIKHEDIEEGAGLGGLGGVKASQLKFFGRVLFVVKASLLKVLDLVVL